MPKRYFTHETNRDGFRGRVSVEWDWPDNLTAEAEEAADDLGQAAIAAVRDFPRDVVNAMLPKKDEPGGADAPLGPAAGV